MLLRPLQNARPTVDAGSAEDVVGEVLLLVWRQTDRFEFKSSSFDLAAGDRTEGGLSEVQRRSANHLDCETIEIEDPADDAEISAHTRDQSKVF